MCAPDATAQRLPVFQERLTASVVEATDGVFEDRVEVTWPALGADSSAFEIQVYRDATIDGAVTSRSDNRIGVVAGADSLFADRGGDPGVRYEYCVVATDGSRTDGPHCDVGERTLNPPASLGATDRTETGTVRLTWGDRSSIDAGYRIERDGQEIAQTAPSATSFVDPVQAAGNVAVAYVPVDGATLPAFDSPAVQSGVTTGLVPVAPPTTGTYALQHRTALDVGAGGLYTFTLGPDTDAQLRVDNDVVIARGSRSGQLRLEAGTTVSLTVASFQEGAPALNVRWSGPSFDAQPLPNRLLALPEADRPAPNGAYVAYYEGSFAGSLPDFATRTPQATGVAGRLDTTFAERRENYALRYRATLRVPETATYTLTVDSDGPSRVLLDGDAVIREQSGTRSVTRRLTRGAYPLVVEYAHDTGTGDLRVSWESDAVPTTALPFTALSLNRVPHDYCVSTVDANGFPSVRRCATGTPGAAQPPENVQASDGQYADRVFLSWSDAVQDNGFRITRRVLGTPDSTVLAVTAPNAISYADTSAEVGTTYRYCVAAQTQEGLRSRAHCDTGIRARLPAPENLQATTRQHDDRIELSWTDPSPAEERYNVYRRPQGEARPDVSVADAVPGVSYVYRAASDAPYTTFPDFDADAPDAVGVRDSMSAAPVGTAASEPASSYALRYRAVLNVPRDGRYAFYLTSSDGSRLSIDGTEVVSNDGVHGPRERADSLTLTAGTHAFSVAYVQNSGPATLDVDWSGPGFERTSLRGSLFPDRGSRIARLPANRDAFTDRDVAPGERYVYHVQATASEGGRSRPAAAVGVRAEVTAPTTVTATNGNFEERVRIEWETEATRAAIHRIYRDGERIKAISPPQRLYSDPLATAGVAHTYCVEAVTDRGVASPQTCATGQRTIDAPSGLSATRDTREDAVALGWTDNSAVTEAVYVHRRRTQRTRPGGIHYAYAPFDSAPPAEPRFDPSTLAAVGETDAFGTAVAQQATNYALRFQATLRVPDAGTYTFSTTSPGASRLSIGNTDVVTNAAGGAETASGTVDLDAGLHPLTVVYRHTSGPASLDVTWEGPSVPRGPLDSDAVVADLGGRIATLPPSQTDFIDRTPVPGVAYAYHVFVTGSGPGRSDTTRATGSRRFRAPGDLRATDATFEGKVDLTWDDASQAESGYVVYRRAPSATDSTEVAVLSKNATAYTDTSDALRVGSTYIYSVAPRDNLGATSAARDSGSTRILPPQSVNASSSYEDRVVLSWDDASRVEDGYAITQNGDPVGTVAANENAFTVPNVFPFIDNTFCVQATQGDAASSERCATGRAERGFGVVDRSPPQADLAIADLDGDGRNDILANARWYTTIEGGTRQRLPTSDYPFDVDVADFNGDGRQDVVFSDGADQLVVYHNTGQPGAERFVEAFRFSHPDGTDIRDVEAADVNGDGDVDLVSTFGDFVLTERFRTGIMFYLENQGDGDAFGTSADPITGIGVGPHESVAVADVDADGRNEIVAAGENYGETTNLKEVIVAYGEPFSVTGDDNLTVLQRDVQIREQEIEFSGVPGNPGEDIDRVDHLSIGDVNGDGTLDLAASIFDNQSGNVNAGVWFEGTGGGDFKPGVFVTPPTLDDDVSFSTTFGDVNGDGTPNLLVASRVRLYWFEADAEGALVRRSDDVVATPSADAPPSLAAADLGGDAKAEVVISPTGLGANFLETHVRYDLPRFPRDIAPEAEVAAPSAVAATDGTQESRVQVTWTDNSEGEDGFRIFRNGTAIGTAAGGTTQFSDADARPGSSAEYCVAAYRNDTTSDRSCDYGYRPPNGALTGRVTTLAGGAVEGVDVCSTPPPGRALQLDGDNGEAVTTGPVSLRGDFTLSFWVKRASIGVPQFVLSQGEQTANKGLHMVFRSDNTFALDFWGNALTTTEADTSRAWHHWAATYDRTSGERVLYRDGEVVAQDVSPAPYEGTGPLVFGSLIGDGPGGFQGHIDEVRIWNRVRPADSIRADRTRPLAGTEEGLAAYWPVEQGVAPALVDPTDADGVRYAALHTGAYRGTSVAPLDVCARTDNEGNYELNGLRYGAETTFQIVPSRGARTFKPAFKDITLSPETPVQNEVAFNDVSGFRIEGNVRVAGSNACTVSDMPMALDGAVKAATDSDGDYAIVSQAGDRMVAPQPRGDRTFRVPERTFTVRRDTTGVNFVDITRRTLSGTAGGGTCGLDIGDIIVELTSETGCFTRRDTLSAGDYALSDLPPLNYTLRVADIENVPSGLAKSSILDYFRNVYGTKQVDLTESDTTLGIIYRAPLAVSINGLPEASSQCTGGYTVEDKTLPNVRVLDQGPEPIPYEVSVAEDYGPAGLCPVDSGTVRIFDEWQGQGDEARELSLTDGTAQDTTQALEPTFTGRAVDGVDRTYQQKITAVAEVKSQTASTAEWALITGRRTREGTDFVTGSTGPVPLEILRDPPGDASSAFVEEGSSFCQVISTSSRFTAGFENEVGVIAGAEFYKGIGVQTKTEIEATGGLRFSMTWESLSEFQSQICATTQESFSTSDDALFTGDQGDVFIGTASNLLFTEMDVLDTDPAATCQIERFTEIGYEPQGFETVYTFSRFHIENSLLPRLSDLMADARRRIAEGDASATARLTQLRADSLQWQRHLQYNDSLKTAADVVENRSFDAGAELSYASTSEASEGWAWETSISANLEQFGGLKVEESGVGFFMSLERSAGFEQSVGGEQTSTDTRTVGYTLSDDDIGDYFSVDVKDDPVYNTPVFELRAGRSSCPWEGPFNRLDGTDVAGTVPRDGTLLQVNGSPEINDVPPNEAATFELTLTNDSQSSEARQYALKAVQSSNPDGARLFINGGTFNGTLDYFLQPGEDGSQKVTLGVERGPVGYSYDDLQIIMYPPCERALWEDGAPHQRTDTLSVSVQFDAPCTDVRLFRPQENWSISAQDDALETIFSDVSLESPRELREVGLQYRRFDQEGWRTAFFVPQDTVRATGAPLADDPSRYEYRTAWEALDALPDGEYELRAYTQCEGADQRVYSAVASGVKDTTRPRVLDTPEPSDRVLAFGDDIAVRFDEPLDCTTVRADSTADGLPPTVRMYTAAGDTLDARARCSDNRIVLSVDAPGGLDPYENETLVAEVRGTVPLRDTVATGITDRVGNRVATAADDDRLTWRFDVKQQGFDWKDALAQTTVDFETVGTLEENLTNGSPQEVVFRLESQRYGDMWDAHPWLQPDVTRGTVPGGETQSIPFAVSDTLAKGVYRDTVRANSALGARDLSVAATVTCEAPFGTPPEGAAYTMNVTASPTLPEDLGGDGPSTDSLDVVAAFVGNELRGRAPVEAVEIDGRTQHRAFLTVGSDRKLGETVTFRLWDSSQCRSFFADETLPFRSNDVVGAPSDPVTLTATEAAAQSVPLASGWTWISVNTVTSDSNAVNSVLSTVTPSDGDILKGQTAFSQYSEADDRWVGSLEAVAPGRAYLLRTEDEGSLVLLGDSVAVDRPIDLQAGWTWLGYLPQQAFPINHALQGIEPAPEEGDLIKSQTAFAQYVNPDVGWLGSLETMQPGRGYFIQLSEAATLAYPTDLPMETRISVRDLSETARSETEGSRQPPEPLQDAETPDKSAQQASGAMPEWTVEASRFEASMAVTVMLSTDGTPLTDPRARIGAFVDGQLRGVARPMQVPGTSLHRAFVLVHGSAQDTAPVTFRIFDPETGRVHDAPRIVGGLPGIGNGTARDAFPTRIHFAPEQPKGTVAQPVHVNAGDLPASVQPEAFRLDGNYPNPATQRTTIRYALPKDNHVTIRLYDLLGRRVRVMVDKQQRSGWHEVTVSTDDLASGVYFYRMRAGSYEDSRKMVVVR